MKFERVGLSYVGKNVFFSLTKWLKMCLLPLILLAIISGTSCDLKDRVPYDYCDANLKLCDEPSAHTMCRYPIPGLSEDCAPFMNEPLSGDEKLRLLSLHNELRNRVANGSEKVSSGYLPQASNMVQMHWDVELETIAARWVERCWDVTYPKIHDDCRNIIRFNVTQNVGTMGLKGFVFEKQIDRIFTGWYKKSQSFSPKYIDPNRLIEVKKAEDYVNLIWADTYSIGCARVLFQKNISANQGKEGLTPWTFERIVCNYGPGGNIPGKAIYKRGTPCSNCPNGTNCGKEYPSLCTFDDFEVKTGATLKTAIPVDAKLLTKPSLIYDDSISKAVSHSSTATHGDLTKETFKNVTGMTKSPSIHKKKTIVSSQTSKILLRAGIYFNGACHCPDISRFGSTMKNHFDPDKLKIKKLRFIIRHFANLEDGVEKEKVQARSKQGNRCFCKIISRGLKKAVPSEFLLFISFFYIIQLINYVR